MGLLSFVRDRKQVNASRATTSGIPQSFAQWNSEFNNNGQPAKEPSILDTWESRPAKPLPEELERSDYEAENKNRINAIREKRLSSSQGPHWTETEPGYDLMH